MSQFDRQGQSGLGDGFLGEMLGVVFARISLGVATTSIDGRIVSANDAFCHLVGYSLEQLLGCGLIDLVHPDDIAENRRLLDQLISGDLTHFIQDVRYLRPDASWLPVQTSVGVLAGGAEPVIVVLAEDATLRLTTQEELTLREGRNQSLVENISDVIMVLGRDSKLTYSSPSVERVFGWTTDDVTTRDLSSFVHPDDLALVNDILSWCFERPGRARALRCRALDKDGNWRTCLITGTLLADDPFVDGVVLVIRDISDQAAIEES
ncbi:MAG: PAS domain-containing protein, partial [Acidimicrobiales bacterium]